MVEHSGGDGDGDGVRDGAAVGVHDVDSRMLSSVPVPAALVDTDGSVVGQNERLDALLGGTVVGRLFGEVVGATAATEERHGARRVDGSVVDVRVSTCDPAPSGRGRLVFVSPDDDRHDRSVMARSLHDWVVPLVMAARLRVDRASMDATDDQLDHLTAAGVALAELGEWVRNEMERATRD